MTVPLREWMPALFGEFVLALLPAAACGGWKPGKPRNEGKAATTGGPPLLLPQLTTEARRKRQRGWWRGEHEEGGMRIRNPTAVADLAVGTHSRAAAEAGKEWEGGDHLSLQACGYFSLSCVRSFSLSVTVLSLTALWNEHIGYWQFLSPFTLPQNIWQ
jgi:hypothetical protein